MKYTGDHKNPLTRGLFSAKPDITVEARGSLD